MTDRAPVTKAQALDDAATDDLKAVRNELFQSHGKFDLRLKKILGYGGVGALVVQILFANVFFVLYADNNGWNIPAAALSTWVAAGVVQIAVIVRTITSYAYPAEGRPAGTGGSKLT